MSAYDREVEILENQLEEGSISMSEFNQAMRDMDEDMRAGAEEAADQARDDYMGQW